MSLIEERILRLEQFIDKLFRSRTGIQVIPGKNILGQDTVIKGDLSIEGDNGFSAIFTAGAGPAADRTLTAPDKSGVIAVVSDHLVNVCFAFPDATAIGVAQMVQVPYRCHVYGYTIVSSGSCTADMIAEKVAYADWPSVSPTNIVTASLVTAEKNTGTLDVILNQNDIISGYIDSNDSATSLSLILKIEFLGEEA